MDSSSLQLLEKMKYHNRSTSKQGLHKAVKCQYFISIDYWLDNDEDKLTQRNKKET